MSIVEVSDMSIEINGTAVLDHMSVRVDAGESVALVGPSGSGKTTLLNAMAGFLPEGAKVSGSASVNEVSLGDCSAERLRSLRGRKIALVPQDARGSLDPLWRIGWQFREAIRAHGRVGRGEANRRAEAALLAVGIEDVKRVMRAFPHRLSGGMCQRVALAMALVHEPEVLLLDEPASMLDAASSRRLLETIAGLRAKTGCALVVVTHDRLVAGRLCDRTLLVEQGRLRTAEQAKTFIVGSPRVNVSTIGAPNAISFEAVDVSFGSRRVLDGLDLRLREGQTLALVGASGCGKSTALRVALGLVKPTSGIVEVDRCDVGRAGAADLRDLRRRLGVVFQDPFAMLDPRLSAEDSVLEFARAARPSKRIEPDEIVEAFVAAGLSVDLMKRRPHELSGGQLQRVCIARAVIRKPRLLLLDEPTSALDSELRDALVTTVGELLGATGAACLFISHDLASVQSVADHVAVMDRGKVVEHAPTEEIFTAPAHEATIELLRV